MAQILAERPIDTASPLRDIDPAVLHDLLDRLDRAGYRFVTVTPASHGHIVARRNRAQAGSLRDIFGWSLPFDPGKLPPPLFASLGRAGVIVERDDGRFVSRVRVSSVHDTLFLHSAWPTTARDSVFLGPDSYRFADLILARMAPLGPGTRILDYAAGAGVGGITAAIAQPQARLTMADINPDALFLAAINAARAGVDADPVHATTPADVAGTFDLIVTHPPFMIDPAARAYRDGGDLYGARLSLDWTVAGAARLAPGGRLILHTGVAIVEGEDVLRPHLEAALAGSGCSLWYHELDPDIFGEELATPAYADVDRIAAVGACVVRHDR